MGLTHPGAPAGSGYVAFSKHPKNNLEVERTGGINIVTAVLG
jgi:hypothetical protein